TVIYGAPIEARPSDPMASVSELVADMRAGRVELLLVLGSNPAYAAPADLDFASAMDKVKLRVHLGLYDDETAALCHWHIPEAHYLESWGDARAYDGTASIVQPLIAPLYGGKSAHELLSVLTEQIERSGHAVVKEYWRNYWERQGSSGEFEHFWQTSLHDGVITGTRF